MGQEKAHNALLETMKRNTRMQVVPGKVLEVDEANYSCDVDPADGGATFFDVRLRAAIGEGEYGTVIIPKVGSQVLVGLIANNDQQCYVCGFSEVERVYTLAEGKVQVFGETLELNGDDKGMLIVADDLFGELNKMTARIDGIIDAITNAVPVAQDGGVALQSTIVAALSTLQNKETFGNSLLNDKVKHGSGN